MNNLTLSQFFSVTAVSLLMTTAACSACSNQGVPSRQCFLPPSSLTNGKLTVVKPLHRTVVRRLRNTKHPSVVAIMHYGALPLTAHCGFNYSASYQTDKKLSLLTAALRGNETAITVFQLLPLGAFQAKDRYPSGRARAATSTIVIGSYQPRAARRVTFSAGAGWFFDKEIRTAAGVVHDRLKTNVALGYKPNPIVTAQYGM